MIKNEMESIKTLFINGKEKNEVKVPKFVNEKFTSLPILLRPINNWEGTNVMYTRLGRQSFGLASHHLLFQGKKVGLKRKSFKKL